MTPPEDNAASYVPSPEVAKQDREAGSFLADWIAALVADLPGLRRLAVLSEDEDGTSFRPLALWPDPNLDMTDLQAPLAQAAAGLPTREQREDGSSVIARPVHLGSHVAALVVVDVLSPLGLDVAERRLAVALGWLAARLWEARATDAEARHKRSFAVLDLMAVLGGHAGLTPAAMAFVTALAGRLPKLRVGLGVLRNPDKGVVRLLALSGVSWFRRKGALVSAYEDAMGEAADQRAIVVWPPVENRPRRVDPAHKALAELRNAAQVASFILMDEEIPVAVLTIESDAPLSDSDLAFLEAVAALAGPVLALKLRQNRWIAGRARDTAGRALRIGLGWNRPSYRLAALAVALVAALPFMIVRPFNIIAEARVEGAVERAVVAPFAGYIDDALARAGDLVQTGDLLLRMDDRDLLLEAERWRSDIARLQQESRLALAASDLAEFRLIDARLKQAEAQLALALGQLDRTELRAPVDGLVLSGDFASQIGAPIEGGALLFTISPVDEFRIVLEIDERDFDLVGPGSTGAMALRAEGGAPVPLRVDTLTPVVRGENGTRLFRAEATPTQSLRDLFPGLEGVARLYVDDRNLAEIWTRRLRAWLAMQFWSWAP